MKFPTLEEIKRENMLKRVRVLGIDYIDIARIIRNTMNVVITRRQVAEVFCEKRKSLKNIVAVINVLYHQPLPKGYKELKGFT